MKRIPLLLQLSCLTAAANLMGCDDEVDIRNAPPEVEALGWCAQGERDYLIVRVRDYERAPVDIDVLVTSTNTCKDNPGQGRLAVGPTGSGVIGLASERDADGVVHLVEWGANVEQSGSADAGADNAQASLDFTACPADDLQTLSGNNQCCERPESSPPEITVRIYANDGDDDQPTPTEATLTRRVGCP